MRPLARSSWCLILLTLFMATPSDASKIKGPSATARKGDILYTQFSLFFERDCHVTTNYRRGGLLPVNTAVTFVKSSRNKIIVTLPGGRELTIENISDFSGENIDGIFSRTLSRAKVDLAQFTEAERAAIMDGKVAVGMRKGAVLVALGYPPRHKTPSLESNAWRYWSSRFGTFLVHFEDGKVVRVQN
jgi:hypothetical protein